MNVSFSVFNEKVEKLLQGFAVGYPIGFTAAYFIIKFFKP